MSDQAVEFPKGLRVYRPDERTPAWVKGKISVDVEEFTAWAREAVRAGDGKTVRLDICESKKEGAKWYAKVNTFVPRGGRSGGRGEGRGDYRREDRKAERPPEREAAPAAEEVGDGCPF